METCGWIPSRYEMLEGRQEAWKVEDDTLENFLDGGAESKKSQEKGNVKDVKCEGSGMLRKYKRFRILA